MFKITNRVRVLTQLTALAIFPALIWNSTGNSTAKALEFPSSASLPPTPVVANRAPLLATPFIALPLGSVRPQGWLLKQCELQRDGLTGNAEILYPNDLGTNSGWLGGTGESWERGPYYYKGLVALAYTLNDPGLKQKAQKWMDWLLDHQRPDGYIGPASNGDWWPRMVATYALKDYYEATGDPRVPTVLSNYFHYMLTNLPSRPLNDWGKARAGDEMDVALWLYNRTGDTNLLSLVQLLHKQAYDWPDIFTSNNFVLYGKDFQPKHNVNVEEALKMPAVYYQLSQQYSDQNAVSLGIDNLMRENALSFGINSGTEFLSGDASVQGVELCAIVEAMLSLETAVRISGDSLLADRLETISFNALPAALANNIKGIEYYTLPNNVIAIYGNHGYDEDYANGTVPGPYSGYPCCRYNFHMGWPKYVQNSWAATRDGGLALIAYGPTVVNAMAGGTQVQITEDTAYPFEERIRLNVALTNSATFPLVVRIPAWCSNATVTVNDEPQSGISPGSFSVFNAHGRAVTKSSSICLCPSKRSPARASQSPSIAAPLFILCALARTGPSARPTLVVKASTNLKSIPQPRGIMPCNWILPIPPLLLCSLILHPRRKIHLILRSLPLGCSLRRDNYRIGLSVGAIRMLLNRLLALLLPPILWNPSRSYPSARSICASVGFLIWARQCRCQVLSLKTSTRPGARAGLLLVEIGQRATAR